jgi:hypothetical protein
MKNICVVILIFWCVVNIQAQDNRVKIEDLETPSSPGFILLDAAPASIESPTTAKAFGTSILNSITQSGGIPKNYAVEFTPFWFTKPRAITFEKFHGIRISDDGTVRNNIGYANQFGTVSFAILAGTGKDSLPNKHTTTSLGYKHTFIRVNSNLDDMVDVKNQMYDVLRSFGLGNIDSTEAIRQVAMVVVRFERIAQRKPVFELEGAVAAAMLFNNEDYNSANFSRAGFWLTATLAKTLNNNETNYVNGSICVRYLADHTQVDDASNFVYHHNMDIGGKFGFEIGKFFVAAEALYRANLTDKTKNTYRLSGNLKYQVLDGLFLSTTFGRNFGETQNAMAFLGLNWTFGLNGNTLPSDILSNNGRLQTQ